MNKIQRVIELTNWLDIRGKQHSSVFNVEHIDNPTIIRNNTTIALYYRHQHWHARSGNLCTGDSAKRSNRSIVRAINGLMSGRRDVETVRSVFLRGK